MNENDARRYSAVNLAVAIVFGEVFLVAIPWLARVYLPIPPICQWLLAAAVLALGGYYLFGLPQIKRWEAGRQANLLDDDIRFQWGSGLLAARSAIGYVVASAIGGSPLIGWWWCAKAWPRARLATLGASCILAAVWGGIYFWLSALLSWWLVPLVWLIVGILCVLTWRQTKNSTSIKGV